MHLIYLQISSPNNIDKDDLIELNLSLRKQAINQSLKFI